MGGQLAPGKRKLTDQTIHRYPIRPLTDTCGWRAASQPTKPSIDYQLTNLKEVSLKRLVPAILSQDGVCRNAEADGGAEGRATRRIDGRPRCQRPKNPLFSRMSLRRILKQRTRVQKVHPSILDRRVRTSRRLGGSVTNW